MEILAVIGVIFIALILFVGGSLLGWAFRGIGAVFGVLMDGCGTTLGIIVLIILGFLFLAALCV